MKCVNCGTDITGGAKFCFKCGSPIVEQQPINPNVTQQTVSNEQTSQIVKKKNPKIIIIVFIATLVVGLSIFGVSKILSNKGKDNNNNNENNNNHEVLSDEDYIIVEEKGKRGIIDINGNLVVPIKYSTLYGVYNGNFYGKYTDEKTNKTYVGIYDINEKEVFKIDYETIECMYSENDEYWIIDYKLYDKNLNLISKENQSISWTGYDNYYLIVDNIEGTIGFMDKDGNIIYQHPKTDDFIYSMLKVVENVDGNKLCIYEKETDKQETVIMSCDTGEIIYDYVPASVQIRQHMYDFYYPDQSQRYMLVIADNKVVYKTNENNNYSFSDELNLFVITNNKLKEGDDGFFTYINPLTGEILKTIPSTTIILPKDAETFDYIGVNKIKCDNGLYKLSKKDGSNLTECIYNEIKPYDIDTYKYLENNNVQYIFGVRDNNTYLINATTGKEEYSFNLNQYNYVKNSPLTLFELRTDSYTVFNVITGKSININPYEDCDVYANYLTITKDNTITYYNKDFVKIYQTSAN